MLLFYQQIEEEMKSRQEIHSFKNVPSTNEILKLLPNAKGIFWDMDGTLFQTESLHNIALGNFLQKYGKVSITKDDILQHFWGNSDPQVYNTIITLWPNSSWPNFDEFLQYKNKEALELILANKSLVFPTEIKSLITELHHNNFELGLVTSCETKLTHQLLDIFEVYTLFKFVITRQDVTEAKPSPIPYQNAINKIKCSPSEVMVFEDSPAGLASAKQAGVGVIVKAEWFSPFAHK